MTKTIRVGLVGWGLGGRYFHAPFIQATPGLELVKVVTSRAIDQELFPGVQAMGSFEALLADESLELIVVASPNHLHVPQALAALAAGRHVVIEKPVGETAVAIQQLISAAKQANRHAIPFQNRRWDGDFLTVKKLVQSGTLGDVHYYEAHWEKYQPVPKRRSGWKVDEGKTGGLLYDLGPHLIDQTIHLFGAPLSVVAQVRIQRPGGLVDDLVRINLTFGGGVHALLEMDTLNPFPAPRFHVRGSRGAYQKFGLDPQEGLLVAGETPGSGLWGAELPEQWGELVTAVAGLGIRGTIETLPGDYRLFYQGVYDALLGTAPAPVPLADVLTQLQVIEAALLSSETGQVIHL